MLGALAGARSVPDRVAPHGLEADSAWYAALPHDPAAATEAFLGRVPAGTRERAARFTTTRYVTLSLRILVLAGSVAFMLFTGAAARMRDLARRLSRRAPLQDVIFALQMLAALFLLGLPLEVYAGFIRLRQAGFSHAAFPQWLSETALAWAVLAAFQVVGVVGVMALIRHKPRTWTAWAAGVYLALSAAYALVLPLYIEPLFNAITPLREGPARQEILALARANGVPAGEVFVRDASRQSELLNAHVTGLGGTARIVLDDNTVARTTLPEIRMVMGHEIGHYVLAHVPEGILFDAIVMGAGFMLVGVLAGRLVARFGPRWQIAGLGDIGALPVLWGLFLLWGIATMPVSNAISRHQEAEADRFGLDASGEPIAQAEFMIRDADAVRMDPPRLEELIFFSHPSPRSRIYAAMLWRAEH